MSHKRSGFSLVLSLAIMASMVMMVIVLAAFLQVETRLAQSHSGYMRARLNAMAAAKIALGQLQQLAGPDQRVTMRADMYDKGDVPNEQYSATVPQSGSGDTIWNPSAPKNAKVSHQKRYWTGVWATGGIDSRKVRDWDVMNPHSSRLFLGWLSSPVVISNDSTQFFEIAEYKTEGSQLNYLGNRNDFTTENINSIPHNKVLTTTGQKLIDDLEKNISDTPDATLVPLLSRGSINISSSAKTRFGAEYYGQVDALPQPLSGPKFDDNKTLGINGRYAFWIGDEGIKAKANLPDAYATINSDGTGYKTPLNTWDDGFRGSAAQRNAIELIAGTDLKDASVFPSSFSWGTWRTKDVSNASSWDTTTIARVKDKGTLILWANTSTIGSTAGGDAMKDGYKALFHDVTPWSYSTITDTYNGGIKSDLSTAFELPYAVYRGLEMSYGQKVSSITTDTYARKASLFHDADFTAIGGSTGNIPDYGAVDFNRPNLLDVDFGSASVLIKSSPRAAEWAPVYTSSLLGTTYSSYLLTQNANEAPERMGFVYEIPLRSAFYGGVVSRNQSYYGGTSFPENLNNRIERGPTWDLYRNYYRLYKREIEACNQGGNIIQKQQATSSDAVFARGCEPLSYVTGKLGTSSKVNDKNYPYGFLKSEVSGAQSTVSAAYRYNMTNADGAQYFRHQLASDTTNYYTKSGSKVPPLPWQTSMKVSPTILRMAVLYSTVWTNQHIGITIDPLIVIHNPYDCAIEFSGISMVASETDLTHNFDFYYKTPPTAPNPNCLIQIGDAFPSQTWEQKHQFSFRLAAGSNGTTYGTNGTKSKVFRLEPGEVKVIGAADDDMKSIDTYGNIDIPCDFIYTQGSKMFMPMEPYAVHATSVNGMRYYDGSTTVQLDPIGPSGATHPNYFGDPTKYTRLGSTTNPVGSKSNPQVTLLDILNNVVNNFKNFDSSPWDGSVLQLNNITGGNGICVKARNQDGLNFKSTSAPQFIFQTPKYAANGTLTSQVNANPRGNTHVADGGYQSYNFFLTYDSSPKGALLSTNRHWAGPVDVLAESLTDGTRSINSDTVNEPLITSLQVVTAGWPLYGNAASGYGNNPDSNKTNFGSDPEFGNSQQGFDWAYTKGSDATKYMPAISRTLPDILGGKSLGPISTLSEGPWPIITKANSTNLLDGKKPFFVCDFFVRGAKECKTENVKNIYYPVISGTYKDARGTLTPSAKGIFPDEIMPSVVSPYAISTRAQSANHLTFDGKSGAPVGWISSQRIVSSGNVISFANGSGNNAFWGESVSPSDSAKAKPVILFAIPRRPLLSLSQLGSANATEVVTDPDLTVGSSFANPSIKDLTKLSDWPGTKGGASWDSSNDPAIPENGYVSKITSTSGTPTNTTIGKIIRYVASIRTDAAFAANLALWDSFWFSGFNALGKSYADGLSDWPGGPNLPTDTTVSKNQMDGLVANGVDSITVLTSPVTAIKTALDSGKNPLANKRVAYRSDSSQTPATMQNTIFPDFLSFPHPTYLGRKSLYDGGFNVNSTSKAAWKAVLGAMKTQKMPDGSVATGTALTRFARAFGSNDGANKPWECYHDITDTELDELAAAVVNEVRRRGPFMSLSDFVNRRLVNDNNFGLKGALQAAIDASTINDTAIDAAGGTFATQTGVALSTPYLPIAANDRFPSARAMSNKKLGNTDQKAIAGLGAPGIISQMDVLNSVGPNLTARSDTFVIRAFGEAFDNNGNSIGKAWIEVVAQRSTDFLAFTDQAAQSLKVSAEPTVRDQTYRKNDGSSKSDYDSQAIIDKYQGNPNFIDTSTKTTFFDTSLKPKTTDTAKLINLNRILGRRFNAVSLRWLNPQDI